MDAAAKPDIPTALRDRWGIERAGIRAGREAAKLHRYHGVPMVVDRDGQPTEVSPEEFEKILDQREAWLNAAEAVEQS